MMLDEKTKNKSSGGEIFSVKIESYFKKELFSKVDNFLKDGLKVVVANLNPEILLLAKKNSELSEIINEAEIKIVDGFGVKLAGFLKGFETGERIAGADLAEYILQKSKEHGLKIVFVMKKGGMSKKEDLEEEIERRGVSNFEVVYQNEEIKKIREAEILLVGLGAPEQERFIDQVKNLMPNLKLAMGTGGTFDFWTGKKKRAPEFMRGAGLEWLWRLAVQPMRIGRIWKATVIFTWNVLFNNN